MKENELFDSLRDKVNDEILPFDESDWQQLRSRLDSKRKKEIIPFIPLSWKYILGGIAATTIMFVLLYYRGKTDLKHEDVVKQQPQKQIEQVIDTTRFIASQDDSSAILKPHLPEIIIPSANTALVHEKKPEIEKPEVKRPGVNKQETRIEVAVSEEKKDKENVVADKVIPKSSTDESQPAPEKKEYVNLPDWNDDDVPHNRNKPVFLSGGGVNYQSQNLGYAVKIGMDKPVTSRFSINAELAVNTNSRNISINEISVADQPIVGNGGSYNFHDTTYNRIDKEFAQAFAQALVGFNYKLYSKGKAGMSVDALRVMRSKKDVADFNNALTDGKTTPLWNVGLRLQYTQYLNHHFDLGAAYRQDVSSAINKTWQNNFLQLMIIYKLNEKKK